jgi:hypothetical protein
MESSRFKGVVIMTASDYVETALYHQREREMNLRNERRRVVLERQGVRARARRASSARGLSYVVRHRLTELFSDSPARG